MNAYRGHMFNVQKEMRMLKEKASEEENKRLTDEKLVKMEQERDWFRNEAVRLDKICKEYKKSAEKWKNKADALEEDRKFLEEQVLIAKKMNLKAKEELGRYREAFGELTGTEEKEDGDRKEDANSLQSYSIEQRTGAFVEHLASDALAGHSKKISYIQDMHHEAFSPEDDIPRAVSQAEIHFIETINQLKTQLDAERRSLRQLKSEKTNYVLEKGELEIFFLQCIEEVRKDILARRMRSAQLLSRSASKVMTRSTSARHFPKAAVPDSIDDIKMEMFTECDKRRVIELLISNEQVLLFLHQSLFPQKKEQSISGSASRLQETPSNRSLNPTASSIRPTITPAKNHGLRTHVFSKEESRCAVFLEGQTRSRETKHCAPEAEDWVEA